MKEKSKPTNDANFVLEQLFWYCVGTAWWFGFFIYWEFIIDTTQHHLGAIACFANVFFSIQGIRRYYRGWKKEKLK